MFFVNLCIEQYLLSMKEVLKYYKDFPKEGIVFVDIIPFLQSKEVFAKLMKAVGEACTTPNIVAPEARGFLFAAPLLTTADHVENIIPVRKSGKLPFAEGDLKEVISRGCPGYCRSSIRLRALKQSVPVGLQDLFHRTHRSDFPRMPLQHLDIRLCIPKD